MVVRFIYYTVLGLACVQWGCAMTPKTALPKKQIQFTYDLPRSRVISNR